MNVKKKKNMKIAYISGPYRAPTMAGVRSNINRAMDIAREVWTWPGVDFVLCPHGNSAFLDGENTDKKFIDGDLKFIYECMQPGNVMVMVPGWRHSYGASGEYLAAVECGIKILEWHEQSRSAEPVAQ